MITDDQIEYRASPRQRTITATTDIAGDALTDDIRLPLERSVSFEPRAGRVTPRQATRCALAARGDYDSLINLIVSVITLCSRSSSGATRANGEAI